MKLRIHKYPLGFLVNVDGDVYFQAKMPKGAQILTLQVQHDIPTVWARVLIDRPLGDEEEVRTFRIFGTGHDLPGDAVLQYVGTFQQGQFVWHVFEENPPADPLDGSYS